jgi:hypothetical protein
MKAQISSTDSTSQKMPRMRLCAAKIKASWLAYATTRLPAMPQRQPTWLQMRRGQKDKR